MKQNITIGVALTLISALFYASLAALIKVEANQVPLPMIVFAQSLIIFVLVIPMIFARGRQHGLRLLQTNNRKLHLVRSFFSVGISYLFFYSISYVPLVNAVLLANSAPLFVPFIGLIFLSQPINHRLWIPLLVGFVGIILVLQPSSQLLVIASLLPLAAAICMATSMLLVRKASANDATLTIIFYYGLYATLISGVVALTYWKTLNLHLLLWLILLGFVFFVVSMALTYALKFANAQLVSALYYSNIIFAAFISILFFHSHISLPVVLGIVLTTLGGVMCIMAQRSRRI